MKRFLCSLMALLLLTQNVFSFGPDAKAPKSKTKHKKNDPRQYVYFEGDYVLGRLNADVDVVTIRTIVGVVTTDELKSLRHTFKSGFKVGFGVFFSRFVEFHASWLRMQNNNRLFINADGRTLISAVLPQPVSITNGYICSRLRDRTQIIDAVIKSRRFFTHDKISALPVIGVRGILMDRNFKQVANNQAISRVDTEVSDVNARLIGLIVGLDLKYTLSRYFNFFGSAYTGAATGRYENSVVIDRKDNGNLTSETNLIAKKSEDFRKFFDAIFGLSFNFNIGKKMNVLIRFGAYIFYFDSLNFANFFKDNPGITTANNTNTFQALFAGGRLTF